MVKPPYNGENLARKRIRDYKKVFGSGTGRDVLMDLSQRYLLMDKITINDLDPQKLAWMAGAQAVLKDILTMLNADPYTTKQEVVDYGRQFNSNSTTD